MIFRTLLLSASLGIVCTASVASAQVAPSPAASQVDAAQADASPNRGAIAGEGQNVKNVLPVADGTALPQGTPSVSNGSLPTLNLTTENSSTPVEREMAQQLQFVKPDVNLGAMPSLFLTLWESDLVVDARRGLNIRPETDPGATAEPLDMSGPREISLGGIVYKSRKNWVIWLNNRRVSPSSIPNEVYDLKVFKDYIELEWFDSNTNQIFPVRMRTYQRFNLDSRIFLPG